MTMSAISSSNPSTSMQPNMCCKSLTMRTRCRFFANFNLFSHHSRMRPVPSEMISNVGCTMGLPSSFKYFNFLQFATLSGKTLILFQSNHKFSIFTRFPMLGEMSTNLLRHRDKCLMFTKSHTSAGNTSKLLPFTTNEHRFFKRLMVVGN